VARPVGRLGKFLFKAPVWLYRAHLGWLLGSRFLMITHIGRKSGLERQTVVEVVAHHDAGHGGPEWFVFAGYGASSDWYRNLVANPPVRVDVGRRRFPAERRFPEEAERRELLTAYAAKHPKAARVIGKRLFGEDFELGSESIPRLAAAMPAVAFRPVAGRS
jgi:deazaflavin-dependent oxidoreductase (nitroreductase family)